VQGIWRRERTMANWAVVDIETGDCLSCDGTPTGGTGVEPVLFSTEDEAMAWAMAVLGDEAGKHVRIEAV
jgi:hypothetical protein